MSNTYSTVVGLVTCQGLLPNIPLFVFESDSYQAVKNRLKHIICLHTFIERVIHSMSCTMHGFAHVPILVLVVIICLHTVIEWVIHVHSIRVSSLSFLMFRSWC